MVEIPQVATQRLLLRPWRDEDRAPFAAMNSDPAVMQYFPAPLSRKESDEAVDRFVARWLEQGLGLWAAERRDVGSFIGFVGLAPTTFDAWFTPAVEVGWRLAREHWGRGFATEGGRAALDFAFRTLALDEVVSFTAGINERSWRVMLRLGMSQVGRFDHPGVPEGQVVREHVLYRITAAEWSASIRPPIGPCPAPRPHR